MPQDRGIWQNVFMEHNIEIYVIPKVTESGAESLDG